MVLRRLVPYWRVARREMAVGAGVLVCAAFLELLQPWPIKWLIDYVFGSQAVPPWLNDVWPSLGSRTPGEAIIAVCVSILFLAVLHRVALFVSQFFFIRSGGRVVEQLRCDAFDQLHRLSLAFHDRTKVGDSLYRVAYDAHSAQTLLNGAFVPMLSGALLLTGATVIMLRINALLTVVTLAAAPLFFLIFRVFGRRVDEQSRQYHENESAIVSSLQESLSSIRAIQAFTLEPQTGERFRSQARQSLEANQRMTRTQLVYSACAGIAVACGTAGVVWVAGHQVMQGRLAVGDIVVFLAYLGMLYQPMAVFSQSASVIQTARAQLRRVFEVIDALPVITDRPKARTLPKVQGAIEFRDVCFGYDQDRPVLKHIDLRVDAGQVLALVGRTGAGKSTIASLLMRFYDPTSGAVLLDGHDLRELRLSWLRRQIAVVLQDPVLFSTSIAENIRYGRPGASLSEVTEAARLAQADEFIRALPQGYETLLGERGVNLSGGQRQRLSIARAFLKNAPILVLDEPTSALDSRTEEALLHSIHELMQGRTTLIIAHRLSTIREADSIVVLDHGTIIERGSHGELLARDSEYRKMYRLQWGPENERESTLVPANNPSL